MKNDNINLEWSTKYFSNSTPLLMQNPTNLPDLYCSGKLNLIATLIQNEKKLKHDIYPLEFAEFFRTKHNHYYEISNLIKKNNNKLIFIIPHIDQEKYFHLFEKEILKSMNALYKYKEIYLALNEKEFSNFKTLNNIIILLNLFQKNLNKIPALLSTNDLKKTNLFNNYDYTVIGSTLFKNFCYIEQILISKDAKKLKLESISNKNLIKSIPLSNNNHLEIFSFNKDFVHPKIKKIQKQLAMNDQKNLEINKLENLKDFLYNIIYEK